MENGKECEKVDPKRIQKMPVGSAKFDTKQVFGMNFKSLGLPGNHQNKKNSWQHMQHVKSGENIQKGTCNIVTGEVNIDIHQINPRIPLAYQKPKSKNGGKKHPALYLIEVIPLSMYKSKMMGHRTKKKDGCSEPEHRW